MKNLSNITKITYLKDCIIFEDCNNKYIEIKENKHIYNYNDLVFNKSKLFNKIINIHSIKKDYFKFDKDLYDKLNKKISDTYKYYLELQDKIEEMDFPKPAEYLLINNISSIYKLLNYSKDKLDSISSNSLIIKSLIVNKINFIDKDNIYFNYDYFTRDLLVYDLDMIYRNIGYLELDKYELDLDNLNLLLCLISIPEEIFLNKSNYINTINIRKLINYVNKTFNFCLEKDKENEKANQEIFEEKNKDVELGSNEDKKN